MPDIEALSKMGYRLRAYGPITWAKPVGFGVLVWRSNDILSLEGFDVLQDSPPKVFSSAECSARTMHSIASTEMALLSINARLLPPALGF